MCTLLVQAAWNDAGADFPALDVIHARGWMPAGPRRRYNVVSGNFAESQLQSYTHVNFVSDRCGEVVSYVNIFSSGV